MKTARWTLGPVSVTGRHILVESLDCFKRAYPEWERVVCFNNVDRSDVAGLDADLHEQSASDLDVALRSHSDDQEEATGCGWKLCPPRLAPQGHELWIDNDIVIRQRLRTIDEWTAKPSAGLISEGLPRRRMYGEFDKYIQEGLHVCAGLFGLPPGFDFRAEICGYSKFMQKCDLGGYDEQGLTAAVVTNMPEWMLVPLAELYISEDHVSFPERLPPAIHFVGANRKPWHRGWKAYQRRRII